LHLGQNKEIGEKLFLRYFGGFAFGNAVMDVARFATKSENFEISGKLFKPNFLEVAMVTNPFILRTGFSVGYRLSRIFNLSVSAIFNYNVINRVNLRFSGTDAGITKTSTDLTLKKDLRSNSFVTLNNRILQDNLFGFNGLQWSIILHYMGY
jgi:hypothetical protein